MTCPQAHYNDYKKPKKVEYINVYTCEDDLNIYIKDSNGRVYTLSEMLARQLMYGLKTAIEERGNND